MTEYIVPMGRPEFFQGQVPIVDPTRYNWVGAYPYLETADTDTSYAEVNTVGLGVFWDRYAGSTLPAFIAPAGITGARVDFQIHLASLIGPYNGGMWWMQCTDTTAPWGFTGRGDSTTGGMWTTPVVGWNTVVDTHVFNPDYEPDALPALLAALATGNMRFSAVQAQQDVIFRVSQLRLTLISTVVPINQQIQRADGLGRGGVPMARGNGTQQASNAARGTY